MKWKGCLLLVMVLSGPGCVSPGTHAEDPSRRPPPVRMVEAPPPPPSVTADQVNESNAAEMAQALAREMDYDAKARPAAPTMAPAMTATNENITKH